MRAGGKPTPGQTRAFDRASVAKIKLQEMDKHVAAGRIEAAMDAFDEAFQGVMQARRMFLEEIERENNWDWRQDGQQ